ncbi:MAG TPA: tetratricopeptide repeat protein [Candidatus Dormibacteraeota bacterium]|nr:tetratricopeptide repeat protein [Candidatus Dormibacteraeota bacterium]
MRQLCLLCLVSLFLVSPIRAQNPSETGMSVEGEVSQEYGILPDDLTVEIYDLQGHRKVDQSPIRRDGRFQLRNLSPGSYWIKIVNLRGDVVKESLANIQQNFGPLSFRIPSEPLRAPGGSVSVNRILHPIPQKAVKEFRRAQKASEEGQMQQSLEHLEKAIQICPEFSEAHNNLGARYLRMGQFDKALKEFETSIALDPKFVMAQVNQGVALMNKKNYPQAESAARSALLLAPQSVPAHYVLGQALALQKKNELEAIENLRKSVEAFPKARLLIAQLLVGQGALSDAARELRAYLASGHVEKKQQVESWLAELEPQ